jgi:ankyrin repeat protein
LTLEDCGHERRDARLIDAVKDGDAGAVHRLLAIALDVNVTRPDGASGLHWAAERDR